MKKLLITYCLSVFLLFAAGGAASPVPSFPLELLGVPYEADGAIDERGRFTYFSRPGTTQKGRGFNCSGFVLAASRVILKKNFTLEEVKRDRLKDSGQSSPYGEDWDFGWDLILNISEGYQRTLILPQGESAEPDKFVLSNENAAGFDIGDINTWKELRNRITYGNLYLLSFNKYLGKKGYKAQHYHVGLIYPDKGGNLWFYNTTTGHGSSYRRNLSDEADLKAFITAFAGSKGEGKRILVIEVDLLK